MNRLIFISALLLLFFNQSLFAQNSGGCKWDDFCLHEEKVIDCAYHYMITSPGKNKGFIYRRFFPETRQITVEEIFSDKKLTTRNGLATYWHENGNMKSTGMYQDNSRTGLWKLYDRKTGTLLSEGNYSYGQPTGDWTDYHINGKLAETYTYNAGFREGAFVQYDTLGQLINEGVYAADTILSETNPQLKPPLTAPESMPYLKSCDGIGDDLEKYECSTNNLLEYVYSNIKYPVKAREYGIQGQAIIQFVVEKDGTVSNVDPIVTLCQDIRDECVRVVESLPQWMPGTQNGEPVRVLFTIPISFRLE